MADGSENAEFRLRDFLRIFSLPQRVSVTEGYYDPEHVDDREFSNGDVMDLKRLVVSTVTLSFLNPNTGRDMKVSVSTKHPASFQVFPYDPDNPVPVGSGRRMVLETVADVVRVWPRYVQATRSYINLDVAFQAGEKMKPLRHIVTPEGPEFVECKFENRLQLVQLPLDCRADFVQIVDKRFYSISDLVFGPVVVKRRLRLADDPINAMKPIAGIPVGFTGDVFMEKPSLLVEAHPEGSPGQKFMIPIDIDITVSAREDTYMGKLFFEYSLQDFVSANEGRFPLVAKVTNWEEFPTFLHDINLSLHELIIMYRVVQEQKVLCTVGNNCYVLPLSYRGKVRVVPRRFNKIRELQEECLTTVKVIRGQALDAGGRFHRSSLAGLSGTTTGEILQVVVGGPTEMSVKKKDKFSGTHVKKVDILLMQRLNGQGVVEGHLNVPLNLEGEYEEVLPKDLLGNLMLSDISSSCYPIIVRLIHDGQVNPDDVPCDGSLKLTHVVTEPCLLASKINGGASQSFHIPLRTKISVVHSFKWDKKIIPPLLSMECAEEVSTDTYRRLQELASIYDRIEISVPPPLPPRTNITHDGPCHHSPGRRRVPPVPTSLTASKGVPPVPPRGIKKTMSIPAKSSGEFLPNASPLAVRSQTLPRGGHDTRTDEDADSDEDAADYEEVSLRDYSDLMKDLFGAEDAPNISIPVNGNLSGFTWQELVVFLQLQNMTPKTILMCRGLKLSGAGFGMLSDTQLSDYGMNTPILRHFRDKSKNATQNLL